MTTIYDEPGARKLTLNEIMEDFEGHVIRLQVREKLTTMPVKFTHMVESEDGEKNYLCFQNVNKPKDIYYLLPTLMGKTWIAWSDNPTAMQRREAMGRG